jgi:hypothetical protein
VPGLPASLPRLDASPTWSIHGSKYKIVTDVLLEDDRVASRRELGTLLRWTSLELQLDFHLHVERAIDRGDPRVRGAIAAAKALWKGARWTLGGRANLQGYGHEPLVRSLTKASATSFASEARKLLLGWSTEGWPATYARTGAPLDVQYDAEIVVGNTRAQLFLPDSAANRKKLGALFDTLRKNDAVTCARLGYGFAGLLSARSFRDGTFKQNGPFGPTQWLIRAFSQHQDRLLAPPWRVHIGPRLLEPERGAERTRKMISARPGRMVWDPRGVLWTGAEAKTPTERKAPSVTEAKRIESWILALHKDIAAERTRKRDARRQK